MLRPSLPLGAPGSSWTLPTAHSETPTRSPADGSCLLATQGRVVLLGMAVPARTAPGNPGFPDSLPLSPNWLTLNSPTRDANSTPESIPARNCERNGIDRLCRRALEMWPFAGLPSAGRVSPLRNARQDAPLQSPSATGPVARPTRNGHPNASIPQPRAPSASACVPG